MYRKILRSDLDGLFKKLERVGKIQAPVRSAGSPPEFRENPPFSKVDLNYTRTMIPPKKFFLKPEETIFKFDEGKGEFKEPEGERGRRVIFGVHPCDINAIKLLDKIYLEENPDKYYLTRRKNTLIVGVSCHPDEYCFCNSTQTNTAQDGFDLFLHDITNGYVVRVGSAVGERIVEENKKLFKRAETADIEEFKLNEKKRLEEFKLELNVNDLQDKLEQAQHSSVWKETADICLGCGTCNLVCPTCRCYDVIDYINLDLKTGEKVRRWDSCMLRGHARIAGGLNFRPTRVERLRNRFNCKGSLREGVLNCVGCGRCTVYCPAEIDFVEVMKKVRGDL